MGTREHSINFSLIKGWMDHVSLRSFPVLPCGDSMGRTEHQYWTNILRTGFSLKFAIKFCSWVFIKLALIQRESAMPRVWVLTNKNICPTLTGGLREFCMTAAHLCSSYCSHLSVWFSFCPLYHFFLSLTFFLHADKFLCFTSPKTLSSSWMSHLSELCSLSVLWPWSFLLASCQTPAVLSIVQRLFISV